MFPEIVDLALDPSYTLGGFVSTPAAPELSALICSTLPSPADVAEAAGFSTSAADSPVSPGFLYKLTDSSLNILSALGPNRGGDLVRLLLRDENAISDAFRKVLRSDLGPEDVASCARHSDARYRYAVGLMMASSGAAAGAVLARDHVVDMPTDDVLPRIPVVARIVISVGTGHEYSARHIADGKTAALDDGAAVLNPDDFGEAFALRAHSGEPVALGIHPVRRDAAGGFGTAFTVTSVGSGDTYFLTLDLADASSLSDDLIAF
jgi:hypothetical protein